MSKETLDVVRAMAFQDLINRMSVQMLNDQETWLELEAALIQEKLSMVRKQREFKARGQRMYNPHMALQVLVKRAHETLSTSKSGIYVLDNEVRMAEEIIALKKHMDTEGCTFYYPQKEDQIMSLEQTLEKLIKLASEGDTKAKRALVLIKAAKGIK